MPTFCIALRKLQIVYDAGDYSSFRTHRYFFHKLQVQARECLFEKQQSVEKVDSSKIIENVQDQSRVVELAQEAQLLSVIHAIPFLRISERNMRVHM